MDGDPMIGDEVGAHARVTVLAYWKFESVSLQQRVSLSPASAFEGREIRLSARVCAAGLATGSAETRKVFRYRANQRQYLCRAIFQYRRAADVVSRECQAGPSEVWAFWGLRVR
jgi:hypothetical protein